MILNASLLEGEFPTSVMELPNLKMVSFDGHSQALCLPLPESNLGRRNYGLFRDHGTVLGPPACGPDLNELEQLITLNGILNELGVEQTLGSLNERRGPVRAGTDSRGHVTSLSIETEEHTRFPSSCSTCPI